MSVQVMKKLAEHDKRFTEHDKRFDVLTDKVHYIGILMEDRDKKLDLILDQVLIMIARSMTKEEFNEKFANHEMRISNLETSFKRLNKNL